MLQLKTCFIEEFGFFSFSGLMFNIFHDGSMKNNWNFSILQIAERIHELLQLCSYVSEGKNLKNLTSFRTETLVFYLMKFCWMLNIFTNNELVYIMENSLWMMWMMCWLKREHSIIETNTISSASNKIDQLSMLFSIWFIDKYL